MDDYPYTVTSPSGEIVLQAAETLPVSSAG